MNSNHRNPGAHEGDVNTEFGGLPHVRAGVVVEPGGSGSAGGGEPGRLTAAVHRRAEIGGAECGFYVLLPSPFPPFTVCARSRFEVFGGGSSEAASPSA